MAVYRRNYRPYSGSQTPEWSRFLVLFRYSRRNLFRSKVQTGFFVLCFFYPIVCLVMIYLAHSASFLAKLGVPSELISIDNMFFFRYMSVQGGAGISDDGICGSRPDFSRSREWCPASVLLSPVLARRVCPWESRPCSAFSFRKSPGSPGSSCSRFKPASPGQAGPGTTCGLQAVSWLPP